MLEPSLGTGPSDFAISRNRYGYSGVPEGIELMRYGENAHREVIGSFRDGYLWDTLNKKTRLWQSKSRYRKLRSS